MLFWPAPPPPPPPPAPIDDPLPTLIALTAAAVLLLTCGIVRLHESTKVPDGVEDFRATECLVRARLGLVPSNTPLKADASTSDGIPRTFLLKLTDVSNALRPRVLSPS